MCFSACLLARFFCLCMYTHGARTLGAWVRPPRREQKVQECKQEEASPQRAMISELGGLAPPKRSSLSLSLSPFSRACIRVSIQVPPFIFLLFAWAMFLGYDNVCFTFPAPYWAITLERWQCLVYFPALCDSVAHDACIYISAYMCVGDCALCMMNSRGYVSQPFLS